MDSTRAATAKDELAAAWDQRIALVLARLPAPITARIQWLRRPERRALRIVAGILFTLGGLLSILPILGIWMLPIGLTLLAEDWPGLKPRLESLSRGVERLWRKLRPRTAKAELPDKN